MSQLIEAKDISTLLWCLNNFSDIPENHLVRMIQLALKDSENQIFQCQTKDNDLSRTDLKSEFLNKILTVPVDNFSLLTHLKQLLDFEDCLALVNYLSNLFSHGDKGDVSVEESTAVLEWAMTLLDAFYQYFILSKDPKVLELMTAMKEQVDELVIDLNDLTIFIPYLVALKNGKIVKKTRHARNYSVEKFRLY